MSDSGADEIVFMMGKYAARIPRDRCYAENHLWLKRADDLWQVGLTAYSVRLLQDVYFLEWHVEPGTRVQARSEIGEIESSKALSSLYAPCEGVIVEFNQNLLDDPTAINTDTYGAGWLYTLRTEQAPMSAEAYRDVLEQKWPEAQRLIKGQIN